MVLEKAAAQGHLSDAELREFVEAACAAIAPRGKKILLVVPDGTRSMPLPPLFKAFYDCVAEEAGQFDCLIALGTHPAMTEEQILTHFGMTAEERKQRYGKARILNHNWKDPAGLATIGSIGDREMAELSGGRLTEGADATINKIVLDYDLVCVMGPVFPHEIAGFSGGNKYFFPGISGPEVLDLFHWLAALLSSLRIIGVYPNPVREILDRAASFIPVETRFFCATVTEKKVKCISFGTHEEAWPVAVERAREHNIRYLDKPVKRILALCPEMYDEFWVAGKCMYKLEPVLEDGGELIIYAPHISEISKTHGVHLKRVGYHVRDYFLAHWEDVQDVPLAALTQSVLVRGDGSYENGVETPRVQVTLASGISEAECRALNLSYRDPAAIDVEAWRRSGEEGLLVVEHAGETLYRLKDDPFAVEYSSSAYAAK